MAEKSHCQEFPNRMLAILAHPDDESFFVGGTLAKFSQQGICVILLCATCGEMGISGVKPDEAGDIRELELREAAKHLGIEVYFMGYQDGELSKTSPFTLLEHISSWIGLVQPQVILTFGPDGVSGHTDHVTISHILTQAFDQYYRNGMLLYIRPSEATALGCGITSPIREDGDPLVSIDISGYKLEKVRAVQCHNSQNPGLNGNLEEEVDKIPCYEVYTIARNMKFDDGSLNWFEADVEGIKALEKTQG